MGLTNMMAAAPAASRARNAGMRTQLALRPYLGRGLSLPQSRMCRLLDVLGGAGEACVI